MNLSDFCEINPKVKLVKGNKYLHVKMEQVIPGSRYVRPLNYIEYKGGGAKFQNGDTLFARITPCLENGKIAQFIGQSNETGFGSTEFFVFRAKDGISDPAYVYYLAQTNSIRGPAEKSMSGASGRQRADLSSIRELDISAPPLQVQQKIASILSAYDDLIENNTRRIRILEEMAQSLYREWFVHFRFPGHEKVKLVDSSLGKTPEGWEVKKVGDSVWINPKTKVPKEGQKPFVPMGSLSNDTMLIKDIQVRDGNSGSKFKNGDTLFARITPCLENGKTGYAQFLPSTGDVAFGSTEFIVLRSKTLIPEYVYLMARSQVFRNNAIKSMSGATGRQRVQEACFEKLLLAQPALDTLSKFAENVRPLFQSIYLLAMRNNNLRGTRDLILPQLISGDIHI
jgi:type I restriction enzyme S subunit